MKRWEPVGKGWIEDSGEHNTDFKMHIADDYIIFAAGSTGYGFILPADIRLCRAVEVEDSRDDMQAALDAAHAEKTSLKDAIEYFKEMRQAMTEPLLNYYCKFCGTKVEFGGDVACYSCRHAINIFGFMVDEQAMRNGVIEHTPYRNAMRQVMKDIRASDD